MLCSKQTNTFFVNGEVTKLTSTVPCGPVNVLELVKTKFINVIYYFF